MNENAHYVISISNRMATLHILCVSEYKLNNNFKHIYILHATLFLV